MGRSLQADDGHPALVGSFRFAITDSVDATKTIEVPVGFCSAPIQVAAGPATVTELGSLAGLKDDATVDSNNPQRSFVSVVSATAIGQTGSLGSFDGLWTESIDVPASSPDSQVSTIQASTITVTFTDQLVTGVIEVCKNIVPGSELTGNFQFTISGANGFSTQRSVPVGACSPGVSVPAGKVEVQETGDLATNVTAITAIQTAEAVDATLGPNATAPLYDLAGAVTVAAVTAGDSSVQTLITFTNDSVRLKLCKIWDSSAPSPVPAFPFSLTTAGPAGPSGPVAPINLPPGTVAAPNCILVGTFRAGTQVAIAEGVVTGTKASSITVNPSGIYTGSAPFTGPVVAGSLSVANRTVTVNLGPGETVVTYTDVPALPGALKVCKAAGPGVASGTVFTFTIGATQTIQVPAGSCVLAGTYPFNSTQTIVETAAAGTVVTAISDAPSTRLVSQNLAARSAQTLIGENDFTEVTFTNSAAPSAPPASDDDGTPTTIGDGSDQGGTTAPATTTVPAVVAPVALSRTVLLGTNSGVSAATKAALAKAAKAKAAKLAKLKQELATMKVKLKKLTKQQGKAKTMAAKHALAKQMTALEKSEGKLAKQIKALK